MANDLFHDVPAIGPDDALIHKNARKDQEADLRNLAILTDLEQNVPYRSIAAKHGASLSTICELAARRRATKDAALKYLMANGLDFAEDWAQASREAAKRGDHRPAKDALLHTQVIDPLQDTGAGMGVTIIIGNGASQAGPAPAFPNTLQVIDTQALPPKPDR
jgi:hypothetical protein